MGRTRLPGSARDQADSCSGRPRAEDQERRDRELQVKVDKLKGRLAQEELTARGDEEDKADAILKELEETRDLSRVIALIDAGMLARSKALLGSGGETL